MDFFTRDVGYDAYIDSSDEAENNTSSEDEIDIILHGTPKQRRKLQRLQNQKQGKRISDQQFQNDEDNSSSEDEFEKEMNAELNQHVQRLEYTRGQLAIEGSTHPESGGSDNFIKGKSTSSAPGKKYEAQKPPESTTDEYYDEIYFDSDEEEEEAGFTRKQKHAVISNDDLLYDPDMDDEDQKWVDQQRMSHRSNGQKRGKKAKMPNSDALLDCPACMTTLCIDCQRHEIYKHQYRAIFVMNCRVDTSETLQCPEQAPKKKKKKKTVQATDTSMTSQSDAASTDLFNPVRCTECSTIVGVIDHDEVYHFFNVLASYT